jgi:hypothetical protein
MPINKVGVDPEKGASGKSADKALEGIPTNAEGKMAEILNKNKR